MTGGIGEHSPDVRADAVAGLGYLGLGLDPDANARAGGDADISAPDAVARTVVVTASEETEIARETARVLGDGPG
jgi:acetate kinase